MLERETIESEATFDKGDIEELADRMKCLFDIRDRKYGFPSKTYERCFVGNEAVDKLIEEGIASSEEDAVLIGNIVLRAGFFHHVLHEHAFKNEKLYYRFAEDEDHGRVGERPDGTVVSWADFLSSPMPSSQEERSLQPEIPERDPELASFDQDELDSIGVEPLDEHNSRLLDSVHPREWINPEPKTRYNLVVIGAGTGGLVSAAGAAGLGAKVALIESHLMGGDCLNMGCVPSKALLRCAKTAASACHAHEYGVKIDGHISVDFGAVMKRMRKLRAGIARHDSATRFSREVGVDVFVGKGRFTGRNSIEVNGKRLEFAKAVIATGGSAAIPPIPGLAEAPYLTNATLFNLTKLPPRLGVIGAGPVGLEMAQAFQRFGSKVTVFTRDPYILPKEDPEAVGVVTDSLRRDGIEIELDAQLHVVRCEGGTAPITIEFANERGEQSLEFDALLVAAGRKPNVNGIDLEAADIDYDERMGVKVNDRMQTSNSNVYAVGDVASRYQFTHMADFMARLVIRNALFFGRDRFSNFLIPWTTFTDPEVAHVGLYEEDLREKDIDFTTFQRDFSDVDRAIVDGEKEGFVKIHVKKGTDKMLGATVVAATLAI